MTADRTVKALEVPKLVVQLADGKEVHHHLAGTEMTIGRDPSNKICLSDHFVSKFHAKLTKSGPGGSWVLTDLGSANKTYVNGETITEATVKPGDAIRFASVQCRFVPPATREEREAAARPAPKPAPAPEPAAVEAPPPAPAASRPQPPAPPPPLPLPSPVSAPRAKAQPKPAPGARAGSAAPKIEDDPMKRLLKIGALLILISLVLGIFLRILLVPSESPPTEADSRPPVDTPGSTPSGPGTGESGAPASNAGGDAGTSASASGASTSRARVDASGNRTAEFYFEEGLSYLDTGRLKDAQASLRKVIELDPDHTRAKTRLSLLDEEIEKQAQDHFDNAREAFQFLRYDEAIAEWEMFLLLADPGDVRYAEAQQGIEQAQSRLR